MLITINNQSIEAREGQTLIEIAREHHITIPNVVLSQRFIYRRVVPFVRGGSGRRKDSASGVRRDCA